MTTDQPDQPNLPQPEPGMRPEGGRVAADAPALQARIREVEAALPRAYEIGRDDAANYRRAELGVTYEEFGWMRSREPTKQERADAISAKQPPADLAERIRKDQP